MHHPAQEHGYALKLLPEAASWWNEGFYTSQFFLNKTVEKEMKGQWHPQGCLLAKGLRDSHFCHRSHYQNHHCEIHCPWSKIDSQSRWIYEVHHICQKKNMETYLKWGSLFGGVANSSYNPSWLSGKYSKNGGGSTASSGCCVRQASADLSTR